MMKGALAWPFMRLYLLTLFYFSSNGLLHVIIPLKGESLGASNSAIGAIMGAYLLTTMVFRPWAGQVIDRFGAVRILRLILIVNGSALLLYIFTGLGGYLLARVLQGVCTAFFSMALQLGIIEALPDKDRAQGISLYSLCSYMPGIIAPPLALAMWNSGSPDAFGWSMVGLAVATGLIGFGARVNTAPAVSPVAPSAALPSLPAAAASAAPPPARPTLAQLLRHRPLLRCGALMLGASLVFGAVTTFMPLYAATIDGANAAVYLMLQALTIVVVRLGLRKAIPSDGQWRPNWVRGTLAALLLAALMISVASAVPQAGTVWLYAAALPLGFAQAVLYPKLTAYLSFALPQAQRGLGIGLFIAMADLGVSLGGLLMGPIADWTNYATMYGIAAGVAAGLLLFMSRRPSAEREA